MLTVRPIEAQHRDAVDRDLWISAYGCDAGLGDPDISKRVFGMGHRQKTYGAGAARIYDLS